MGNKKTLVLFPFLTRKERHQRGQIGKLALCLFLSIVFVTLYPICTIADDGQLDCVDSNGDSIDSDADGSPDCIDQCPYDSTKLTPDVCGCGFPDFDSDNDGTYDCIDECPNNSVLTSAGICGCNSDDSDGDGQLDCVDSCDDRIDSDADGVADCNDQCPYDGSKLTPDVCGCGSPDLDSDNDGTYDCNDSCNDQIDSDGDGSSDCVDVCTSNSLLTSPGICGCNSDDSDGDGQLDCVDSCDERIDSDLDGLGDCRDSCPADPSKTEPGNCGCNNPDSDTDSDGLLDCHDNCDDSIDTDSDTIPDCQDECPNIPNSPDGNGCPGEPAPAPTPIETDPDECVCAETSEPDLLKLLQGPVSGGTGIGEGGSGIGDAFTSQDELICEYEKTRSVSEVACVEYSTKNETSSKYYMPTCVTGCPNKGKSYKPCPPGYVGGTARCEPFTKNEQHYPTEREHMYPSVETCQRAISVVDPANSGKTAIKKDWREWCESWAKYDDKHSAKRCEVNVTTRRTCEKACKD